MKKILLVIIFIFGIIMFLEESEYISEDSIRFRVIANSNSIEDIKMKELVVADLSNVLLKNGSIESTRENIINNISVIESRINNIFDNNNYDKTYNVVYGMNNFPKKIYNGVVYEEGMYESLVIEIGDGLGNNYWCFLYPSLCFADYQDNDEKLVYKSKIVEIINKLF